jgi:ATP-dependent helicase/nuclease subunit A
VTTPPPADGELPDAGDRRLIVEGLGYNLFIAAGAGAGKTRSLVERIVHMVRTEGVPLSAIVAITFTEKAAAELRVRVRQELERAGMPTDGLDEAPIGTLHAFARRLLAEFPTEVGLPPRFSVLDEVQSTIAFDERFDDFIRTLLDDPAADRLVQLCSFDTYQVGRDLRRLALGFQDNWDLVDERVDASLPVATDLSLSGLADEARRLATLAAACDTTARRAVELRTTVASLEGAELDEHIDGLGALTGYGWSRCGSKESWKRVYGDDASLAVWRADGERLARLAADQLQRLRDERRQWIGAVLRGFTLAAADARRHDGELEFHDLLVLARRLLRQHPDVRRALHQRFRAIFLDEFQDTDPIQLELALRLCADPDDEPADWRDLQPLDGRLCVVGDPKQSIYRFRRADIAAYLRAAERLEARPATLTSNFRSSSAVIDWVNHTMGALIVAETDVQPAYVPLTAQRPHARDIGSVTLLGADAHVDRLDAETLRTLEATDVAAIAAQAVAEGWPVLDDEGDGPPVVRPCRLGDICILLPARTSLSVLESALAARGLPYRAENSSLVYATDEIRALLLALRAVDDPTDELAVVSVLRTSLFGCSDRHLLEWRTVARQRFSWSRLADEDFPDHPVADALRCLGRLHRRARTATPAQLLTDLVEERMVLELAVTQPEARDVWRRVRFVVDQARAWSDAGGHGLRHYLEWVQLQSQDGRFVTETVLPESDHDAIRIMTIHAAKGLEFPITIVSGLTTRTSAKGGRAVVWTNDGWAINDTKDAPYQLFVPVDEQMNTAERIRLWYVACTRARDHLVVSTHRLDRASDTAARRLAVAAAGAAHRTFVAGDHVAPVAAPTPVVVDALDEAEWWQHRTEQLEQVGRPRVISATSLATQFSDDAGLAKGPVDLDLPPWQRGRYGTQVGRAVHAVLQHADLRTGDDIVDLARAQAAAEGLLGLEGRIATLAHSALAAEIVRHAVDGQHWRELFVATTLGDTVVEGYIDLLVRTPDGQLVVVDYKTDRIPDGADAPARIRQYSLQLAAYGLALEDLLGEPVAGGVLVMCREGAPAAEVPIADWAELGQTLRQRLVV